MSSFEGQPAPLPPELLSGQPPEELLAMRAISRRHFLTTAGVITGGFLIPAKLGMEWRLADEALNDSLYPGEQSPIVTLGYEGMAAADLPHAEMAVNLYAGLGQRPATARRLALKLANQPYKGKRISYTEYAPQGINTTDLADEYKGWESTFGEAELFLNSMGSITWAAAMAEEYRRGQEAQTRGLATRVSRGSPGRPKPLKTITFCSSPFDINDTYQAGAVRTITEWGASGTLTEKFLVKLGLAISSNQQHTDVRQFIERAARETFDQLPPKMWATQICQLGSLAMDTYPESYAGIVTPDTLVMYLLPKQPQDDRVVNVVQAAERFRDFFTGTFGCRFETLQMEGAGHADVDRACECAEFKDLLDANSGLHI